MFRNFSNCAAWHLRAKVVASSPSLLNVPEELDLVHNAFFTEPDDQSVWMYFRFLLSRVLKSDESALRSEASVVEDLLREEPNAKWPMLASVWIATLLPPTPATANLIHARLDALRVRDPLHARFYDCVGAAVDVPGGSDALRVLLFGSSASARQAPLTASPSTSP